MNQNAPQPLNGENVKPGRFYKMKDVVHETSLHRATIYRKIGCGEFPQGHKIGARRVWTEAEVEAWKAEQISAAA